MITNVLVANRGEIAARVFRTCRQRGIATVAVYSDADADALHVVEADEAVHIGPTPAIESYLRIDSILAAAKRHGIRPGIHCASTAFAKQMIGEGFQFVTLLSDNAFLNIGAKAAVAAMREGGEAPAPKPAGPY